MLLIGYEPYGSILNATGLPSCVLRVRYSSSGPVALGRADFVAAFVCVLVLKLMSISKVELDSSFMLQNFTLYDSVFAVYASADNKITNASRLGRFGLGICRRGLGRRRRSLRRIRRRRSGRCLR